MMRAIEVTQDNVKIIANSGIIEVEDAQALWEHVHSLGVRKYFVADYRDKNNRLYDWTTMSLGTFEDELVWSAPSCPGFRSCRRR